MTNTAVVPEPPEPQPVPAQPFTTVKEAAAILRVHHKTLLTAISDGEIPAVRVGRQFRIPTAWLLVQTGEAGYELVGQSYGLPGKNHKWSPQMAERVLALHAAGGLDRVAWALQVTKRSARRYVTRARDEGYTA